MLNVRVNLPKKEYDIFIGKGLFDKCEIVESFVKGKKVCIVSDSNVFPLYGKKVEKLIENAGGEVFSLVVEAGENAKSFKNLEYLAREIIKRDFTRSDVIVALGGGVVGDLTAFCASVVLRGVKLLQMPTSLLSQVDSSVGGKTGVDLAQGKNLVGAFHQPIGVLIDPDTLNTLPDRFIADGMAEVIKYGCIKDAAFFENLESVDALSHIEDVIETCVSIKRDVVSRDEREAGERVLLNFGHTLGHAIEKIYNFTGITHGMAVAVGMVLISRAGEKQGITPSGTADRIAALCEKYGLPTSDSASFADMAEAAMGDKKTAGSSINLVLLKGIGESVIYPLPLDGLEDFITT